MQRNKVSQGLALQDSLRVVDDSLRDSIGIANQYTAGGKTYVSGLSTLVMELPAIDSDGNNLPSTYDYAVVTPDSSNSKILRYYLFPALGSTRTSKNQVLSTNLSKVNFFYYDNSGNVTVPSSAARVNITLNTYEQSALSTTPSSASSDVNLRND
jgi:hypothetical protein